jgi:hypothetical protein
VPRPGAGCHLSRAGAGSDAGGARQLALLHLDPLPFSIRAGALALMLFADACCRMS